MSRPHWSRALEALGACPDAVRWARAQKSYSLGGDCDFGREDDARPASP